MTPPIPEPDPVETDRLRLRAFRPADAPRVRELAGDEAVARDTLRIPHPYEEGMAEEWIRSQAESRAAGEEVVFAVTLAADDTLVGACGLVLGSDGMMAEIGFWIGVRHWGRGYATEAARAVIGFGFRELGVDRIFARHFRRNPASGRVLAKAGCRREGRLRRHVEKDGERLDVECYGILRSEWRADDSGAGAAEADGRQPAAR